MSLRFEPQADGAIDYRDFIVTDRLQRVYPIRAKAILAQTDEQTPDAAEQRRVLEWIVTVFAAQLDITIAQVQEFSQAQKP